AVRRAGVARLRPPVRRRSPRPLRQLLAGLAPHLLRQASMSKATPIPMLKSAIPNLSGTYSFMQVRFGGTNDDVWPGSGERLDVPPVCRYPVLGFLALRRRQSQLPLAHQLVQAVLQDVPRARTPTLRGSLLRTESTQRCRHGDGGHIAGATDA